jgi:hypothetical protein
LGDFIVYRNLNTVDPRLPRLEAIRPHVGLAEGIIPRKSEAAYASVIAYLLKQARTLDAPHTPIKRILYIGDTQLNDGNAFLNICNAGNWRGAAFIGAERQEEPPHVAIVEVGSTPLYLANRWGAVAAFDHFCRTYAFPIDEQTAVITDLDKTTLGARGRNDKVIDQARVTAVERTVASLLGEDFNPEQFKAAYALLNQTEFHPFTTDNQDYLAYICLIIGSGLFRNFIAQVDARLDDLPENLQSIHSNIYARVQKDDPTPFKTFRYNEYWATIERMGSLEEEASATECLAQEITITQEVREIVLKWKAAGALIFGLSDKPDEASLPPEEFVNRGYQPIHRTRSHAIGE